MNFEGYGKAKSFLENASSQMCDRVLNTTLLYAANIKNGGNFTAQNFNTKSRLYRRKFFESNWPL